MSNVSKLLHPLRAYRHREGLSLADLSDSVGLSRMTISRIERGERRPSPEVALMLEEATGIRRWHLRPDIWGPGGRRPA
jgi:transcriptional regulator with XRE-family HTH domain